MTASCLQHVGLMGGTFDPIHYGHLVAAEEARDEFKLERVIFIPSGHPPHKKDCLVTPAEHRYRMTVLATASNHYFEVSRIEIDRPGLSYTIDTVTEFRRLLGPEPELYFITGADAILEILHWKDVEDLLRKCRFIAATRPGFPLEKLKDLKPQLPPDGWQRIHFLEVPALAISSTDIRRRVREGKTIKYLLPEAVEEYIRREGLYLG
ncbi:nicotinate-nucleotide adenylyltransferase [Moorellaceae bacterium AZ2]